MLKCRMIDKTADYGLAAVTAIMVGVGVMMFLLPPVPGVPVYMTLGIVLPAQGHGSLGKLLLLSCALCFAAEQILISFIKVGSVQLPILLQSDSC